ncbi:ectoine/hydroxyectoine ABC transporter permease subunit EhuC [Caldalkalibacillus thermarum]|uniref:ectoine/hydroxyectoine ABC transporter permease subunit EhuC n=1 Tax=Caldalkalibacillus thermarum TaxID=296745 RepID=UPI00166E6857|nr:ectoine/hydroxyectoine ABC transporter permease subunit EhuC [Caldalkalibacillus thermarum]GGK20396.1 ectoine/hydroxyectoine ABC transporter permease subunit EhuC [Caldalkalibacillus thermarum]
MLLLQGVGITVQLLVYSALLAFIIAFIAGFGRLSKYKLIRGITVAYVEFFRGTSLLVQLFWFYFVLPFFGLKLPSLLVGVIAMGLNYGAYASEIVRSAILAIPKEQTEAAIALNMTLWQRMRLVILPQAIKIMLPGFGNISIELLKGTALVVLIGVTDVTYMVKQILIPSGAGTQYEMYSLLLVVYFILALPLILTVRWLEKRAWAGGGRS